MKENWELHWKDYYKILQVHQLAESEVVKAAYNKLHSKYHPDHNPGKEEWATGKAKEINEAFEILSNPQKRTAYDAQYNRVHTNPIETTYPPKSETTTKANSNVTYDATQSMWCSKCYRYTDMNIVFIDNKPASSTCPTCHITYDLRLRPQPKTDTTYRGNLTLDEKINLLFIMLSNNKSMKFREREWRKKRDQVREALKFQGTASKLGECPNCKIKSVLANSDASAGWCINPKCDYMIGYVRPSQPPDKQPNKHWF